MHVKDMHHAQADPHLPVNYMSLSLTLFSRSPCIKTGVKEEHALTLPSHFRGQVDFLEGF